jgi:riboflavin biosynthesis pyrimidine reductase
MIAERPRHAPSVADGWRIEPLVATPSAPTAPTAPNAPATPTRAGRGGSLPPRLARRYGSDLAIALRADRPTFVANFVTTLDGVVAFDTAGRTGGREVSGGFPPDRFLMGLLRATADAVLVGAGTVRSGAGHVWTADHVHPPAAGDYAAWRAAIGLATPQPTTIVVSASGEIDPRHPGFNRPDVPVLVVTTRAGAGRLERSGLPRNVDVAAIAGAGKSIDMTSLASLLAGRGVELVLCEGGPTLFGGLVETGLVDELFLTVAPQIAGRSTGHPRLSLVEGLGFEPGATPWATLSSVLRAGDHLFLRYTLTKPSARFG